MSQKNKPPYNWNAVVRSAIRRSFARSPKVIEVMNAGKRKVPHFNKDGSRAKVDRVEFECQVCHNWVPAKLMGGVDHIIPVISVEEGFQDWNTFIDRINCDIKNLQRLCKKCHDAKTLQERRRRQSLKDWVLMDQLEERLKSAWTLAEEKDLKKQVNKFLSKTKADNVRERALKLKEIIINKLKED
jgi:5-methylcytosine-specific restriction endonuclease McrA